ncbi:hypothetical protein [Paraclostridium sp. AKS73]|uniref:hypothetical protein n=1 Tax=Paraclostridium sp. AKS73 TaxID=2876116 RepID=UPI0021E0DB87|nr:hypothetical protein [Paraclostridium sp. AKS73]MCU9814485.1 hypothetical protein [Paraclostridium sp. AKS73]
MKRVATYLIMILVVFISVGCNQNDKHTNLKVHIGESINFSDEEINKAVDCLKSNFDFEACTLTKIYYDEKI